MATTYTCQQCGATFARPKQGKNPAKYCSLQCTATAFRGVPLGPRAPRQASYCLNCGERVTDYPSRGTRQFCSQKCQTDYCYTMNTCRYCGTRFRVMRSRRHRQYCNSRCYARSRRGVGNHKWNGGLNPFYYGPDWKQIAEQARQRDGYRCQRCGKAQKDCPRALDVHHIRPYTSFGHQQFDAANQLSNLITLCHPCHMMLEGKPITDW